MHHHLLYSFRGAGSYSSAGNDATKKSSLLEGSGPIGQFSHLIGEGLFFLGNRALEEAAQVLQGTCLTLVVRNGCKSSQVDYQWVA